MEQVKIETADQARRALQRVIIREQNSLSIAELEAIMDWFAGTEGYDGIHIEKEKVKQHKQ